ncbi:P-loop containing nucleoside triphosphate hydrolase protein [Trametes cingulata]|nr:P-loop containing nucleoside triphosphate hydrolase protein [Trametes cingulata]
MSDAFAKCSSGMIPHEWQLDVAEALHLGLDCTVIAGTGAGKTIPYLLPLLLPENRKKIMAVISPLKALQNDQARRFRLAGISARAVNGDTWDKSLATALLDGAVQAAFTSPEMFLKHPESREVFSKLGSKDSVLGLIVDEAHCISQWGGDFRPVYGELSSLRATVPMGTPVGCFSATMTRGVVNEVEDTLLINSEKGYYLNLGNDRPNIFFQVVQMEHSEDISALDALLELEHAALPSDIPKTLIFVNTRAMTQRIWRHLLQQLPTYLRSYIDFLHAFRRRRGRQRVMNKFTNGDVKILVATEAAGMGADIPDIERVIQFGAPSSLSVWMQRAGRAGRSKEIAATAILLVEKSVFQKIRRRSKKRRRYDIEPTSTVPAEQSVLVYRKKVDPSMRMWLEGPGCRRDITDKYFSNPARQYPSVELLWEDSHGSDSGEDSEGVPDLSSDDVPLAALVLRSRNPLAAPPTSAQRKRPLSALRSTTAVNMPQSSSPGSQAAGRLPLASNPSRPSATPYQSRPVLKCDAPSGDAGTSAPSPLVRTGALRKRAIEALQMWRAQTFLTRYAKSPFSRQGLLSDDTINILAYDARIKTIADIEQRVTSPAWIFAPRHGQEVLDILRTVDEEHSKRRAQPARPPVVDENMPPTPTTHQGMVPSASGDVGRLPVRPRPVRRLGVSDLLNVSTVHASYITSH